MVGVALASCTETWRARQWDVNVRRHEKILKGPLLADPEAGWLTLSVSHTFILLSKASVCVLLLVHTINVQTLQSCARIPDSEQDQISD